MYRALSSLIKTTITRLLIFNLFFSFMKLFVETKWQTVFKRRIHKYTGTRLQRVRSQRHAVSRFLCIQIIDYNVTKFSYDEYPPTTSIYFLVTARVRSTREGNVLTRVFVSVHTCRWGVPHLRSGEGGTSSQVWSAGGGGTSSQVWPRGVPHPRSGQEGYPRYSPNQVWMGYPRNWDGVPPGPGMGYNLDLGWGTPPDLGWGTPQHSKHLLHGGWYASCVHAGGLSSSGVVLI